MTARIAAFALALAALPLSAQELPNLPPITPEDLAITDNKAASGGPAMMLHYAVDTDNTKWTETHSVRIKVFRDEGRKYANIEIPYFDKASRVEEIRARTIGRDGKAVEFNDQVYDREIVKAKKYRVNAKVFTLPNVEVGSILEYSYRLHFKGNLPDAFRHPVGYLFMRGFTYPAAEWTIQRELFVRHAHLTLRPVKGAEVREHYVAMPKGAEPRTMNDGTIQLDIDNLPAYEEEEYSPPEENLKTRVDIYYAAGFWGPESYWTGLARTRAEQMDTFMKKSKAIDREVARLIAPNDSEEAKLRKIYARVQQIRAVSYEGEKTEKERKQENLKENKNVEDVLNRGYAYANEINLLFVALARSAGFVAFPMQVTSRKRAFFLRDYPSEDQLSAMVVQVKVKSDFIYLDPATRYCPFGLLPWEETDAGGIRLSATRPDVGITPISKSSDAVTRWKADLHLKEDGELQGKVEVNYLGQEALSRRLEALQQDEAAKRKDLEEAMKNTLGQNSTVKLLSVEGWESSEAPLKAEFEIEVPSFATQAGKRWILPAGVFHTKQQNPFPSPRRTHPIYFSYPQEGYEDVRLELPAGMQVESLPAGKKADQGAAYYEFSTEKEGAALRMKRAWRLGGYLFVQKDYPILRGFYDRVLAGDAQQLTLRNVESAQAK